MTCEHSADMEAADGVWEERRERHADEAWIQERERLNSCDEEPAVFASPPALAVKVGELHATLTHVAVVVGTSADEEAEVNKSC